MPADTLAVACGAMHMRLVCTWLLCDQHVAEIMLLISALSIVPWRVNFVCLWCLCCAGLQ